MTSKLILFLFGISVSFMSRSQQLSYGNNSAAGKYLAVNGINMYYEVFGKGPVLLMLHGNGGNISAFEKQIPFFAKYYRVIAVDSRLQGKSGGDADTLSYQMMAADFCALLDKLKVNDAYVLGWSDGGINGLLMAMKCPARIKALAITGANVVSDSTALPADMIKGMKDFIGKDTFASKKEITLNRMMLYQPDIAYSSLSAITCPVLVMAGDHDIIKPEHTLKIFKAIPGAELCIFPDSHHGVCQQHPLLFNKTVLDFFKRKALLK